MSFKNYIKGDKLYGDDFDLSQIRQWYEEEKEAYSELYSDVVENKYPYHEINKQHAFNYLKGKTFDKVLSFGGAFGDELLPIINLVKEIYIVEPSDRYKDYIFNGVPVKYIKPEVSGLLNFENLTFDLVTCFGVLHHVPNVSTVFSEIVRVMKKDAYFLLREPIVSMGNWDFHRPGLTKNERGLPYIFLKKLIQINRLQTIKSTFCVTKPFDNIFNSITKLDSYNSKIYVLIDKYLALMFKFNHKYHPNNLLQKIRPTSVFLLLKK